MMRTIRTKFFVGFFLIFIFSFLVLNQTVKEAIRTSNQKIVTSDLVDLKKNSTVFMHQLFLMNHVTDNKLYLTQMAQEMVSDLHHSLGIDVGVYTEDGVLLHSSDKSVFSRQIDEDLKLAISGKTAYNITYDRNGGTVLFSFPIVVDDVRVGILRFAKDYALLYEQSGRVLEIISYISLAIYAVAFLFSYILSRHISIPLVKLTNASTEVKNGNLEVRLHFNRKDEIGRLAVNFNDMIDRISSQISTIKRDRDLLKELNQQEKRFFDNITHELKTPLTSILGYAEMIRVKGEADREFFDKGMNHIIEESRRLHGMVLKLLDESRRIPKNPELERVDAGKILHDVCDAMSFRAKRYKKSIVCETEGSLLVYGHADRLRQLFINLLDNAIKYSSLHSKISVKAGLSNGKALFIFTNRSESIEPDQLANVFQPFYSVNRKSSEEGSVGLGLSIAQSIVDEHGGSIRIVNENHETIVYVEIPYMKAEQLS